MNFYPHHIGDFNNATRHLTRVERSVYRDAMELYYDTEKPLTLDFERLARKLICISEQEMDALLLILSEFFSKKEAGYVHERCDIEIAKYQANTSAKAKAGIASAEKRKQNSTGVKHVLNACSTNQEPITNNQEPITNNQEPSTNIKPAAEYSAEFLEAWEAYPTRPGANKKESFKAWNARLKYGADAILMIDGVRRYATFCRVSGTEKTYIKQPQTFFGPGDHYLSDWTPQTQSAKNGTRTPSPDDFETKEYGTEITLL